MQLELQSVKDGYFEVFLKSALYQLNRTEITTGDIYHFTYKSNYW